MPIFVIRKLMLNNTAKYALFLFIFLFVENGISWSQSKFDRIDGLTVVGVPTQYKTNPIPKIEATNANWICLVPYGFGRKGETSIRYNLERQWWGEKEEGIVETLNLARQKNLKILLKPQVYFHGSWPGDLDFDNEKDWLEWEKSYREFIFFYLDIANRLDIEMFCIGTEFKKSEKKRNSFWVKLIKEAREKYCGELTYSANWDSYDDIKFWNELDYIGISAYFPLLNKPTPKVNEIIKAWSPYSKQLEKYSKRFNKKILFTEYGYLSVDGTTFNNWDLEKKIYSLNKNENAQANALEAMYRVFFDEPYWAGGFLWKWFPNNRGHEGYIEKDYTPQDKLGENVLKKYFAK